MVRTWLCAALISRRLRAGGQSIREIARSKKSTPLLSWTRYKHERALIGECEHDHHIRCPLPPSDASRYGPWPRTLVRSLCQFLDAIQSPSDAELKPSDLPAFGGGYNTMAAIYNHQEKALFNKHAFSFTAEKRALLQLKKSREARDEMMRRLKRKTSNNSHITNN